MWLFHLSTLYTHYILTDIIILFKKDLQRCTFYNQHQNQSGTAHPLNNLFRGAQEAWATCVQKDHPGGNHKS